MPRHSSMARLPPTALRAAAGRPARRTGRPTYAQTAIRGTSVGQVRRAEPAHRTKIGGRRAWAWSPSLSAAAGSMPSRPRPMLRSSGCNHCCVAQISRRAARWSRSRSGTYPRRARVVPKGSLGEARRTAIRASVRDRQNPPSLPQRRPSQPRDYSCNRGGSIRPLSIIRLPAVQTGDGTPDLLLIVGRP
jgi:hypothetical protein